MQAGFDVGFGAVELLCCFGGVESLDVAQKQHGSICLGKLFDAIAHALARILLGKARVTVLIPGAVAVNAMAGLVELRKQVVDLLPKTITVARAAITRKSATSYSRLPESVPKSWWARPKTA